MSSRAYYSAEIGEFLSARPETIIGRLTENHSQDLVHQQTGAWKSQVEILQQQLQNLNNAYICFELLIPRMGKRADVVLIIDGIIFVLEFKVGEAQFKLNDVRQTQGYALDLSCFHEASHNRLIIPILIATNAPENFIPLDVNEVGVTTTLKANSNNIQKIIKTCVTTFSQQPFLDARSWLVAQYKPTPTIVEAAQALYANHDVTDIARSDAGAVNLAKTSGRLNEIIHTARINKKKTICFVTGVPGAGKTLVGLDIATRHNNTADEEYAVFLSGNGPLVDVLREALAVDQKSRHKDISIGDARRKTSGFIQNIHHFRDDALVDLTRAPINKVVIFDEAQRAWNLTKASDFMQRKRGQLDFNQSEPEFLISVMDRHKGWCVIIALIGGGQEINDGEAGLDGWFKALADNYSDWTIHYSEKLKHQEYAGSDINFDTSLAANAVSDESLHLATSMRSFRAEKVSHMVHYLIHNQSAAAANINRTIAENFPIYVTRNLSLAKAWIKKKSRGLESCGLIASSGAKRLKPEGIFVNDLIKPVDWFLRGQDDVRSCHFLEDTATEFVIQGLELDWCIVAWDADYRYHQNNFQHWKFTGTKWMNRKQEEQKRYLENSYRVLLTRARQGMVIFIPEGNLDDVTRLPDFYDQTYKYLLECGIRKLPT